MADEIKKTVTVTVNADTDPAEKKLEKLLEKTDDPIYFGVGIDEKQLQALQDSLTAIKSATIDLRNTLKGAGTNSGFNKIIRDVSTLSSLLDNVVKVSRGADGKSLSRVQVSVVSVNKAISEALNSVKELNSSFKTGGEMSGVFSELRGVLVEIKNLIYSIADGLDFKAVRPTAEIAKDIEYTSAQIDSLIAKSEKYKKLSDQLKYYVKGNNVGTNIIHPGDNPTDELRKEYAFTDEYASSIDNMISKMQKFVELGGQLKDITFRPKVDSANNPILDENGVAITNMQQLYDILLRINRIQDDFASNAKAEPFDLTSVDIAKNKLEQLNLEMDKAAQRAKTDLKVEASIDTSSLEQLTASITSALKQVELTVKSIPTEVTHPLSVDLGPDSSPAISNEISNVKQLADSLADVINKAGTRTSTFIDGSEKIVSALNKENSAIMRISSNMAGLDSSDVDRFDRLAVTAERLASALKDIDTSKLKAIGKTSSATESPAYLEKQNAAGTKADSQAIIAEERAYQEIERHEKARIEREQTLARAKAMTAAAEEKAFQEMERHEKARIDRERAEIALAESKRKLNATAAADQEKEAQALEKLIDDNLKYYRSKNAEEAEYRRLREQYLEKNRRDVEKLSKSSTGGETGVFATDPKNFDLLERQMRALANATKGIIPESIQFNQATKKMSFESKSVSGNIDKYTVSLNKLTNELVKTRVKTIQASSSFENIASYAATSVKKVASYLLSFGSFYKLWDAFRNGISIIKDIDDAMTELKKVSDETAYTYERFQGQAAKAGREVAQTTSDMIKATADWKKMGYNLQESLSLAKASSLYVNVGDNLNITEATSDLVSTLKAFNMNAKDATGIVDRLNAVSNNYAVTTKDLGSILNHASSSLAAANTSLDKTIAMGAAMNEVLQDSSISGSTLKVLAMRLRGAKVELEAAGESTDGMAISVSKLRDKIKALTNVDGKGGFDIMIDENTFKDIYVQVDGIAEKWKDMNDISRASLLELIAGKNRAQGVSALLNNWSEAESILRTSLESSGSAEKENAVYLESISGKLNQLKAQYQELWQESINDDMVKFFIDLGTSITKLATDLGGIPSILGAIAAAVAGIKIAGKEFRSRDNECALLINVA